jgi:hypothetical protein
MVQHKCSTHRVTTPTETKQESRTLLTPSQGRRPIVPTALLAAAAKEKTMTVKTFE